MRRKGDKSKAAVKKPAEEERPRRYTRSRRNKSPSASPESEPAADENENEEEVPKVELRIKKSAIIPNPEEKQETQVWQVKTEPDSGGEIQKLKICLQRPSNTPERLERSPRRHRKHRRGTPVSQTDEDSGEEEKKKHEEKVKKNTVKGRRRSSRRRGGGEEVVDSSFEEVTLPQVVEVAEEDTSISADVSSSHETNEQPILDNNATNEHEQVAYDEGKNNAMEVIENPQDRKGERDSLTPPPVIKPEEEVEAEVDVPTVKNTNITCETEVVVVNVNDHVDDNEPSDPPQQIESNEPEPTLQVEPEIVEEIEVPPAVKLVAKDSEKTIEENNVTDGSGLVEKDVQIEIKTKELEMANETLDYSALDSATDVSRMVRESPSYGNVETCASNIEVIENVGVSEPMDATDNVSGQAETNTESAQSKETEKQDQYEEVYCPPDPARKRTRLNPVLDVLFTENQTFKITSKNISELCPEWTAFSVDDLNMNLDSSSDDDTASRKRKDSRHEEVVVDKRRRTTTESSETSMKHEVVIARPVRQSDIAAAAATILDTSSPPPRDSVPMHPEKEVSKRDLNIARDAFNPLLMNRKISIVDPGAAMDDDDVLQRPASPAMNPPSVVLHVRNLVRPFTNNQLRELLSRTGNIVEGGFWIDGIKSQSLVRYETEEQAVETRNALHGVHWPVANGKRLLVDYSTEEELTRNLSTQKDLAPKKPETAEMKPEVDWREERERERKRREERGVREWDLGKGDRRSRSRDRNHRRDDSDAPKERGTPEPKPKKKEAAPAKMLDDLFRKTKAAPCIYWLPLTDEQIAVKEEQRRKHMADLERRLKERRAARGVGSPRRHSPRRR